MLAVILILGLRHQRELPDPAHEPWQTAAEAEMPLPSMVLSMVLRALLDPARSGGIIALLTSWAQWQGGTPVLSPRAEASGATVAEGTSGTTVAERTFGDL